MKLFSFCLAQRTHACNDDNTNNPSRVGRAFHKSSLPNDTMLIVSFMLLCFCALLESSWNEKGRVVEDLFSWIRRKPDLSMRRFTNSVFLFFFFLSLSLSLYPIDTATSVLRLGPCVKCVSLISSATPTTRRNHCAVSRWNPQFHRVSTKH